MKLVWTNYFIRTAGKFTKSFPELIEPFKEKIRLLEEDIYHPALKTHKLKGKLSGLYSSSISYSYRIVYRIEDSKIILLNIGSHDETY